MSVDTRASESYSRKFPFEELSDTKSGATNNKLNSIDILSSNRPYSLPIAAPGQFLVCDDKFWNPEKGDGKKGNDGQKEGDKKNDSDLFASKDISESLIKDLVKLKGKTAEEWKKILGEIRDEIKKGAKDPDKAILDLVEKNRVIIFGEYHDDKNNPSRDWVAKHMEELKKKGITHIALEVNATYQPVFDDFLKTGVLDFKKFGLDPLKFPDNYMAVIEAARKNGMKIVCTDDDYWETEKAKKVGRDGFMADKVAEVLKADKNAKVFFLVGQGHAGNNIHARSDDKGPRSMATVLRSQGYDTATVGVILIQRPANLKLETLPELVKDVKKPVAIETKATKQLKALRQYRVVDPFEVQEEAQREKTWGEHDLLIIFPPEKK